MSFIDKSNKNIIRLIETSAAGGVGGFVGRAGRDIDALFAGPFHPDSGHGSQNKQLLQKQLKDRREQRKDIESDRDDVLDDYSGIPDPVGGYYAGVEDEEEMDEDPLVQTRKDLDLDKSNQMFFLHAYGMSYP